MGTSGNLRVHENKLRKSVEFLSYARSWDALAPWCFTLKQPHILCRQVERGKTESVENQIDV
jgi:hypothetical protein